MISAKLTSASVLLDLKEPRVAQVFVFDLQEYSGRPAARGLRYCVHKNMICPNGQFRITYAYRKRRDAAVTYARRWIAGRIAASTRRAA